MNSIKAIIGWVRDSKGRIVKRNIKDICNAVTTMVGGGHTDKDGLANTTPYVIEIYKK